jgi:hypothetical protein
MSDEKAQNSMKMFLCKLQSTAIELYYKGDFTNITLARKCSFVSIKEIFTSPFLK